MTIVMPAVKQSPSPNYTPSLISHDLFVLHDQEGHTLPSVSWLCNPQAKASAHLCLSDDSSTVYQLVPLQYKAWAQCAGNSKGVSLEMPGFAARGFSDDLLRTSAIIAAWYCRSYSIPLVWAQGGQGRGLCCHHDGGAAWGGHTDVGDVGGETWQRFMTFVRNADADLAKLPSLPVFALNGLPGPHEVVAIPPDTIPSASHCGAPRCEPGDVHAHPTPSGFPAHSIAALQSDLNVLMNASLTVDGWLGPVTQTALRKFQVSHACDVDGQVGPQTWRALDKAINP